VWLSNLVAWVTRRASADDVTNHLELAARLLLRLTTWAGDLGCRPGLAIWAGGGPAGAGAGQARQREP
jgi:hypothetical protein